MGDVYDEPDGLEVVAWEKQGARCWFGCEVPFVEKEIYEETGLCGWCAHREAKD